MNAFQRKMAIYWNLVQLRVELNAKGLYDQFQPILEAIAYTEGILEEFQKEETIPGVE